MKSVIIISKQSSSWECKAGYTLENQSMQFTILTVKKKIIQLSQYMKKKHVTTFIYENYQQTMTRRALTQPHEVENLEITSYLIMKY